MSPEFDPTKKIIQKTINPEEISGNFETAEQIKNIKEVFKMNPELKDITFSCIDKEIGIQLGRSKLSEALGKVQNINVSYKGNLIIDSDSAAIEKGNIKLFMVTKEDNTSYVGDIALPQELRGQGLGVRILQKIANILDTKIIPTYMATGGHTSPDAMSMWKKIGNEITPDNKAEEMYASYLETIFPESKIKEILWHGTINIIEGDFKENQHFGSLDAAKSRVGFVKQALARFDKSEFFHAAVLNFKNPKRTNDLDYAWAPEIELAQIEGFDGLVYVNNNEDTNKDSYVVFKPDQIHILGSASDIDGFKNFIETKDK